LILRNGHLQIKYGKKRFFVLCREIGMESIAIDENKENNKSRTVEPHQETLLPVASSSTPIPLPLTSKSLESASDISDDDISELHGESLEL